MTKKRFYKLVMSFGYSPREARRAVEECRKSGLPYVARFALILPGLLLHMRKKKARKMPGIVWGLRVEAEITDEGGGAT